MQPKIINLLKKKYIGSTSTRGATLTEHLPSPGRESQTPRSARKLSTLPRRMKGKKEAGRDLRPWEGAAKEERFPHPGKTLAHGEISRDRKGASEAQRRARQPVCGRQKRETSTEGPCYFPADPSLKHTPAGTCGVWGLKLRLQRTDQGRGLGSAAQTQPEGAGVQYGLRGRSPTRHRSEASLLRGT